jgi:CubicO group peptidase (beta-lactamase class C family)
MSSYFPPPDAWARLQPEEAGMSAPLLEKAVEFAEANESDWPQSLFLEDGRYVGNAYVEDQPPHDKPLGVVRPRGGASGLILRRGRLVAEWGDTVHPDTTFSAAKSYLGLLAGIALDEGLIDSVDDPVARYMPSEDAGFASGQNRSITWRHLLQQTSEWRGTLWGIPDSVDHNRRFGSGDNPRPPASVRAPEPPGTHWEYNDVRVNRLALSLLHVFREPLPDVLRMRLMDPIGASRDWEWHGYANSVVPVQGKPMISVSGGGHWGGGLFISARDHARVGLLVQNRGLWNGRALISAAWMDALAAPAAANPLYGYLWWLNTARGLYPSAPASSLFAIGGGHHLIWVDRDHELVMVARWVAQSRCNELIDRVMQSLR